MDGLLNKKITFLLSLWTLAFSSLFFLSWHFTRYPLPWQTRRCLKLVWKYYIIWHSNSMQTGFTFREAFWLIKYIAWANQKSSPASTPVKCMSLPHLPMCFAEAVQFSKKNLSRQTKDRVPAEITLNKTATKPVSNTWEQGQRFHPKRPWRGASHKHNLDANWRVWQDEEKKGSVLELAAYLVAKYLVPVDLGSGDGKLSAQSLEGCVRHCHVVLRQSPLDKTTTQKQLFVMFMAGFIQKILLKFTNVSQTFAIWATQRYATLPHSQ